MRSLSFVVGAMTSAALAGCAVSAPDPAPGPDITNSTATAIVAVERTVGPGETVRSDTVVARFVRVRQGVVDEAALRVAGIAEDVPPSGSCTEPADATYAIASLQGGVELLDVGQVTVAGLGSDLASESVRKSTVLLPRAMPDPAGVVSGVFYSVRSTDTFTAGSKVALRSTGGADLDGFAVNVTAPRDLADVRVQQLSSGFDVTWDGADSDVVYVDVLAPTPRAVIRCTASENGHLSVPYTGADDGQIAVHRLHRESFRAKGLSPGEVRFDLAKIVAFRRP